MLCINYHALIRTIEHALPGWMEMPKLIFKNLSLKIYLIIFFCLTGWLFLSWPVGGLYSDTDLWYHLSGGRYFFQQHRIVSDSHFSFITPAREFINYYWLFQIIVYIIHTGAGYYGLIFFKTALYLTTLYLILRLLTNGGSAGSKKEIVAISSFALYALAIMPRELFLIRPHLFSYLFIVWLIFILEKYRKMMWGIPPICMACGNIHGMVYPVMLLIIGAYFGETVINRYRSTSDTPPFNRKQRLLLIASVYCLFITPHGISLLSLPFDLPSFLDQAIGEMAKRPFFSFFQVAATSPGKIFSSAQNIIVIAVLLFSGLLIMKRSMRISHLVMLIGAMILVNMNTRLTYLAVLLMLPTAGHAIDRLTPDKLFVGKKLAMTVYTIILILVPGLVIYSASRTKPHYPLSYQQFPFGITAFLNHIDTGGNILNEHNAGGLMQFELNPGYKLFMDLQLSMFDTADLFESRHSRSDPVVFERVVDRYHPAFICVRRKNTGFTDMLDKSRRRFFAPVFFDDSDVLFVNVDRFPVIAKTYELKHVDPFETGWIDYREKDKEILEAMLVELKRMQSLYDKSARINTMMGNILVNLNLAREAEFHADNLMTYHPEKPIGYALKGQVSFFEQRYEISIGWFNKALKKSTGKPEFSIVRNLYQAYSKTGQFRKAYRTLSKNINVFDEKTSYKDLYNMAVYAATIGKRKHARILLRMAGSRVPESDPEYLQKIQKADFWK